MLLRIWSDIVRSKSTANAGGEASRKFLAGILHRSSLVKDYSADIAQY